jgi:hypothetical protein
MKFIAALFILSVSVSAFSSEEVYQALRVPEKTMTSSGTATVTAKEVAGVECFKTRKYAVSTKYECTFSFEKFDSEKVYKALKVSEVQAVRSEFTKTAGSLSCLKIDKTSGKDSYSCKLITASVKGRPEPRE